MLLHCGAKNVQVALIELAVVLGLTVNAMSFVRIQDQQHLIMHSSGVQVPNRRKQFTFTQTRPGNCIQGTRVNRDARATTASSPVPMGGSAVSTSLLLRAGSTSSGPSARPSSRNPSEELEASFHRVEPAMASPPAAQQQLQQQHKSPAAQDRVDSADINAVVDTVATAVDTHDGKGTTWDETDTSPVFSSAPLPATGPTSSEQPQATAFSQQQQTQRREKRQGAAPPLYQQQQRRRQREPPGAAPPLQQRQQRYQILPATTANGKVVRRFLGGA